MIQLFNMPNRSTNTKIQYAVEYVGPSWVVLILNPGSKDWTAVRSQQKMVRVFDNFGDEVKKYPAIETFATQQKAEEWVAQHLADAVKISRSQSDIAKFLMIAKSPITGSAMHHAHS